MAQAKVVKVSPEDVARASARLIRGQHRLSAQQRKQLSAITGVDIGAIKVRDAKISARPGKSQERRAEEASP